MRKNLTAIAVTAVCLLLVLAAAYFAGYRDGRRADTAPQAKAPATDTVVVRDTVHVDIPYPVDRWTVDTILIAIRQTDTLTIRDTLYMELPRESQTYESKDYKCVISGYLPSLDLLEVYPSTTYVSRTTRYRTHKWGFSIGAQIGFGTTPKGWLPYIGIGGTAGYRF